MILFLNLTSKMKSNSIFLLSMHEAFDYCFLPMYSDEDSFILLVTSN